MRFLLFSLLLLFFNVLSAAAQPPQVVRIGAHENSTTTSWATGSYVGTDGNTGVILTCWHLMRDNPRAPLEVYFPDGSVFQGTLIASDAPNDLAAIRIPKHPTVRPARVADTIAPDGVLGLYGYGNPRQGLYRAASARLLNYTTILEAPEYGGRRGVRNGAIEVSISSREGDSGGPIFDTSNRVVGVIIATSHTTSIATGPYVITQFLQECYPQAIMQPVQPTIPRQRVPGPDFARVEPAPQPEVKPTQPIIDMDALNTQLDALTSKLDALELQTRDPFNVDIEQQLSSIESRIANLESKPYPDFDVTPIENRLTQIEDKLDDLGQQDVVPVTGDLKYFGIYPRDN